MKYEDLNDENFLLYAAQHYDNAQCHSTAEFYEDLKKFKYIKKLVTRYVQTGDLKERLILNHIIVLNNIFGPVPLCRMIFLKMPDQLQYIKPFLLFINILPDIVQNVNQKNYHIDDIPLDGTIIEALRKI